jgi:hypothetical protein
LKRFREGSAPSIPLPSQQQLAAISSLSHVTSTDAAVAHSLSAGPANSSTTSATHFFHLYKPFRYSPPPPPPPPPPLLLPPPASCTPAAPALLTLSKQYPHPFQHKRRAWPSSKQSTLSPPLPPHCHQVPCAPPRIPLCVIPADLSTSSALQIRGFHFPNRSSRAVFVSGKCVRWLAWPVVVQPGAAESVLECKCHVWALEAL